MSTSDRELLELAAKAAGIDGKYFESEEGICIHTGIYRAGFDYYWNPLLSDSEALRLAAALKISVEWCAKTDHVSCCLPGSMGANGWERATPEGLRRAIVRAAAEIGRSMP